ncbi:MAG: hypothetical protein ACK2UJ_07235 [Candidatus Promineifilaceae bacterium]|jgi:hypothetical protein
MPLEDPITLSRAQLGRLVQGLAGIAGYPNPEDPHEPGPWDPVIQNAFLNRADLVLAGPQPQPWKSINWALLNPQPLPPHEQWAQIAARAIVGDIRTRMALMQSLPEEFHAPIVEGIQANLSQFADEVCGSEPWRWPFPPPRPWPPEPDPDPREMLANPLDLIIMGVVFDSLAGTVSDELQGPLQDAAAAIQNAGFERL